MHETILVDCTERGLHHALTHFESTHRVMGEWAFALLALVLALMFAHIVRHRRWNVGQ